MEELIEAVNKLQTVCSASECTGIDLPQIVVVGTQSSGKSSVLENIVGKSFLPRGTGIVTRCPLVLQLSRSDEEYASFQHDSSKNFTDFALIYKEIEEQTVRIAGSNKAICSTPIILKLFSPSHLDLTLVDLPGLTKVPVGDQPEDIEEQIKSLVMEYVKNPNSIILTVVPANVDMATSESIKISRSVDPEGKRTLCVVTKLDLMDQGTNANEMLDGQVIPVKLGIIGVINRSQKDIMEKKSVEDSLADEAIFFKKNYKRIASKHGTEYLKKTVQRILINHIESKVPQLLEKINRILTERREELKIVGEKKMDQPTEVLGLIKRFSNSYCSQITGNVLTIQTTKVCGGAMIKHVFQHSLSKALESVNALTDLTEKDVLISIINTIGISQGLFLPELAFEELVKKQIKKLGLPCLECVELVHDELKKIGQSCLHDKDIGLHKYPKLQENVNKIFHDSLLERIPVTIEMVQNYIDIHLAYINTSHPDFTTNSYSNCGGDISNRRSYMELLEDIKQHGSTDTTSTATTSTSTTPTASTPTASTSTGTTSENQTERDCTIIKELIKTYFSIVKETIHDNVPKVIVHFLVKYVMEHLETTLVDKLYEKDNTDLLQESPEVNAERDRLLKSITALEEAKKTLNSFNTC